jgi:hypothetical protein
MRDTSVRSVATMTTMIGGDAQMFVLRLRRSGGGVCRNAAYQDASTPSASNRQWVFLVTAIAVFAANEDRQPGVHGALPRSIPRSGDRRINLKYCWLRSGFANSCSLASDVRQFDFNCSASSKSSLVISEHLRDSGSEAATCLEKARTSDTIKCASVMRRP